MGVVRTWMGATAVLALALGLAAPRARAGDHREAPDVLRDGAADIADFYAWHTDESLVLVITFQGYSLRGDPVIYDPGVLYGFHIDTDADNEPDRDIWVRFGLNQAGEAGVLVQGVPGEPDPIMGPVEQPLGPAGGTRVFAGLRDDPFFFDAEGLNTTLVTGDLSFIAGRDRARFQNAAAIVVEFPLDRLDESAFSTWAATYRKPGTEPE